MTEGIGLGMGFKLDAKSHLDVRKSFKTVEEMKNFPETSIPEGFTTFNEATGLEYQFLSTNEVSETLGKWRVKEYGSGNQYYTVIDKPQIRIDDLGNGNYLLNGNVENVMEYSNEICFIYITGTHCYITGLSGEQCAFKNNNGVWKPLYYDGFMLSKDINKLMEKKIDKSSLLSNTKENATDKEVYSAKYINALKKLIDALSSIISDTSISTDTTYSSYKIDLDMSNMKDELKLYMNTAIAGLNKLSKEIINDKSLVVKDNVLYLYKADDDVSNNYMQMMLINGVAVELGSTQVDMSDYYNKTDSDNRFAAKLDLDTLTNSFNTHIGDTTIHITQDEKDSYVKKTDIATALDDTATDEQVTSALLTKTELDKLSASLGELSELKTTEKTNLVGAINETRQSNGAACTLGQGVNLTKNQIFVCPNDGYIVGTLKWNASGYFTIMVVDGSKATQIMQYGHKSDPGANINLPMYVRKGMSIRFVGTAGAVSFYPFE